MSISPRKALAAAFAVVGLLVVGATTSLSSEHAGEGIWYKATVQSAGEGIWYGAPTGQLGADAESGEGIWY